MKRCYVGGLRVPCAMTEGCHNEKCVVPEDKEQEILEAVKQRIEQGVVHIIEDPADSWIAREADGTAGDRQ